MIDDNVKSDFKLTYQEKNSQPSANVYNLMIWYILMNEYELNFSVYSSFWVHGLLLEGLHLGFCQGQEGIFS